MLLSTIFASQLPTLNVSNGAERNSATQHERSVTWKLEAPGLGQEQSVYIRLSE
jgi:hypothetical protein